MNAVTTSSEQWERFFPPEEFNAAVVVPHNLAGKGKADSGAFLLGGVENLPDQSQFLNDLRQDIEAYPFVYEGKKLNVTMTFGLALSSKKKNIDSVIRDADERLYAGKYGSKNRVVDESNFESQLRSKKQYFDSIH